MQYKVTIGRDNKFYGLDRDMFEVGETVKFKVLFARDASMRVTTDDVQEIKMNYDSVYNYYSFVMPDHDVRIDVGAVSDMVYDPSKYNPAPAMNNNMGFMGMGFMKEPPQEVVKEEKIPAKKFCTFCGEKIIGENSKFCRCCGAKINENTR